MANCDDLVEPSRDATSNHGDNASATPAPVDYGKTTKHDEKITDLTVESNHNRRLRTTSTLLLAQQTTHLNTEPAHCKPAGV